ncbi:hypothetical protein C4588_07220 [Candidatus Parcubacteria bacterium]|nr:MAG: hypothetical protein C4588_07220 [Candidatus Parcubacteria bacterium]
MAVDALNVNMNTSITGAYQKTDSTFGTTSKQIRYTLSQAFAFGTGNDQANRLITSSGSVNSTGFDFDVSGAIVDAFGDTVSMAKVVAVVIRNKETTSGRNLLVGAATFPVPLFNNSSDIVVIGPSGSFDLRNPDDGYPVVAGSADQIKLAAGGAYTVEYDLFILGRTV